MQTIPRPQAMDFLLRWQEKSVIKVISGLRRCGKSTLLLLFREKLQQQGVSDEQIQSFNFEDLAYEPLTSDYHLLYQQLQERLVPGKMNYIFLDEVQHVQSFEKVVDSLYIRPNVDLYITGSNA